MKKQKPKPPKKAPSKKNGKTTSADSNPLSWVDNLEWHAVDDQQTPALSNDTTPLSIISWNVLADAYCNRRSHQHLPLKYQRHVFDRHQRQHHVRQTLRKLLAQLSPDLLALQEVDPPLEIAPCLQDLGYDGLETPSSPGGKAGRVDACALYWKRDTWRAAAHRILRLDDIATSSSSSSARDFSNIKNRANEGVGQSSLQGVQASFVRKNMALLVRLQHTINPQQEVVVAVMHLFWNPAYEYVKLCQAHYVLQQARLFIGDDYNDIPFVLAGDLNSQPMGNVHRYLVEGFVNAKWVAPWYSHINTKVKEESEEEGGEIGILSATEALAQLSIQPVSDTPVLRVRYMLDFTLNRFCRWLRILGQDAALETDEEERLRTKNGKICLFDRCVKEQRTLVTTSSKLVARKDCPPGAYLLDTKSLANLELTLVHLLLSHGVVLEPNEFLSRCVVCNGSIEAVHDEQKVKAIFACHQAPEDLKADSMDVFQCTGCSQGYWWCDRPTSSASRVKSQATKLFESCLRGGVQVADNFGMFSFVNTAEVLGKCPEDAPEQKLGQSRLDIVHWLQEENLGNPFGALSSVYANEDGLERLPFTNVTAGFVGHLDYIMIQNDKLATSHLLHVPKTFEEMNGEETRNGHLLPSNVWPSDHLAVGAKLRLPHRRRQTDACPTTSVVGHTPLPTVPFCAPIGGGSMSTFPTIPVHGERCSCGCVPSIPSLFEMAELRKQARLK